MTRYDFEAVIKLTSVGFRSHVKIASLIVSRSVKTRRHRAGRLTLTFQLNGENTRLRKTVFGRSFLFDEKCRTHAVLLNARSWNNNYYRLVTQRNATQRPRLVFTNPQRSSSRVMSPVSPSVHHSHG